MAAAGSPPVGSAAASAAAASAAAASAAADPVLASLQSHNAFFDDLVNMFPAQLYLTSDAEPVDERQFSSKYKKGNSEQSKVAKKAKNKANKASKFKEMESTLALKKRKWDKDQESDGESDGDDQEEDGSSPNDVTPSDAEMSDDGCAAPAPAAPSAPPGSRIDELRRKLASKIAEKRQGRPERGDAEGVSKRAARKQAKKARVEAAKKKAAEGGGGF
ncbi:hypothetical protein TeGR_g6941, partial [Tetraparma gracilis]